jgi:hypothetical protein
MKDAQLAPSEIIAQQKSADGRMATEAARLKRKKSLIRKRKNRLDTDRPSHGRTWDQILCLAFRPQMLLSGFASPGSTCPLYEFEQLRDFRESFPSIQPRIIQGYLESLRSIYFGKDMEIEERIVA